MAADSCRRFTASQRLVGLIQARATATEIVRFAPRSLGRPLNPGAVNIYVAVVNMHAERINTRVDRLRWTGQS